MGPIMESEEQQSTKVVNGTTKPKVSFHSRNHPLVLPTSNAHALSRTSPLSSNLLTPSPSKIAPSLASSPTLTRSSSASRTQVSAAPTSTTGSTAASDPSSSRSPWFSATSPQA